MKKTTTAPTPRSIRLWRLASVTWAVLVVPIAVNADFRIAGYLPDYRFDSSLDLNASAALLDDLYLFSLSPQTQLGPAMFQACCLQEKHYTAAAQAVASTDGRLRAWVTVGGGGRSHKFTDAPSAMINALRDLIIAKPYIRGVDFDCETFYAHQEYERYEKLLTSAATLLHSNFPDVQVSVALHAGQTMPTSVFSAVDRVNLMTYDMPGATYHADYRKTVEAVENLVDTLGCPAAKVFLGIPAYGKHKHNPADVKTYHEVVTMTDDDTADLHRRYEFDGYLLDSPAAVQAKIRLAQKKGLGGVFFWELGQDYVGPRGGPGTLLKAAAKQVGKAVPESSADTSGDQSTTNNGDESTDPATDGAQEEEVRDEL